MQFTTFLKLKQQQLITLTILTSLFAMAATSTATVYAADSAVQQGAQDSTGATQKIDHLLELIDKRLSVASEIAKAKWNSNTVVDNPEKDKEQLASISTQATAMGVTNLALFDVFFQNQFEANKIIQARLIMHWHSVYEDRFRFNDAPDLMNDVDPRLDKLTPELIAALQEVQPLLDQPGMRNYLMTKANQLVRDDVNGEARRTALMTFESE
jgi:chorismate mutase